MNEPTKISTGSMFSDAMLHVDCDKCGSKAGTDCRQPKGKVAWPPHGERIVAVQKMFPPETWQVKAMTFHDILDDLLAKVTE